MNDWLVVLSEHNWEVCASEGLLGLGRDAERRLNRVAVGDRVWVYVNRKHVDRQLPRVGEIRSVVRVSGNVRYLARSPWKARGDQRFNHARPIIMERRFRYPAKELLKTMAFAGRPPIWGMKLINAPVPLTCDDVQKLEGATAGVSARQSTKPQARGRSSVHRVR